MGVAVGLGVVGRLEVVVVGFRGGIIGGRGFGGTMRGAGAHSGEEEVESLLRYDKDESWSMKAWMELLL